MFGGGVGAGGGMDEGHMGRTGTEHAGAGSGTGVGGKRSTTLRYKGCSHFRQRLVCATLSQRAVRIDEIREHDDEIGLRDFEASFLRLLDKLTNGTKIVINETGTSLKYKPGFITGGTIEHDCGSTRAIGWFIEALVQFAPFAKKPIKAVFTGVTNNDIDFSIDTLREVTVPVLKNFGIDAGLDIKIKRRGAPPKGGGMVIFTCPTLRKLRAVDLTDAGFVKRIRGIAYTTRVAPTTANRVVDSVRSLCNKFIPDVYVHTDHYKGKEGGSSPGWGLSLVASTTTGCLLSAERAGQAGELPEDLGLHTAQLLMEEIGQGGCVDSSHQAMVLHLMALCPEDVSKLRVGKLSDYTIQALRLLKDFYGIVFKIKAEEKSKTVLLSCMGLGFTNMSKKVT